MCICVYVCVYECIWIYMCVYTHTLKSTKKVWKHKCVISGNGQKKLPNILLHSLKTWTEEEKITHLGVFQY